MNDVTRFCHKGRAGFNLLGAVANEDFDFFGRLGGTPRQAAYFTGDYCKASALLAGPCSFYCSVKRQDIGLKRNAIDDADDVGNLAGACADVVHALDHFVDNFSAARSGV